MKDVVIEERPNVEITGLWPFGTPTLDPSKPHTCHITLKNPTSKDWTYDVSLTLSGPVSWSSDSGYKVCPAGKTRTYDVEVTAGWMEEGTYDIYISVLCQETGEWILDMYDTGKDVIFKAPVTPDVSFVSLSWD